MGGGFCREINFIWTHFMKESWSADPNIYKMVLEDPRPYELLLIEQQDELAKWLEHFTVVHSILGQIVNFSVYFFCCPINCHQFYTHKYAHTHPSILQYPFSKSVEGCTKHPTNVLDMTLNWLSGSSPGDLGNVEYHFITIIPKSTLTRISSIFYLWIK